MPITTKTAEHYTWGQCCDAWYLAKTPELHVIQEHLPSGAGEKLHFHENAFQFFYVLAGKARFLIDGRTVVVAGGESISVLPGLQHRVESAGPEELRLLVVSQPPSHGDRIDVEP